MYIRLKPRGLSTVFVDAVTVTKIRNILIDDSSYLYEQI